MKSHISKDFSKSRLSILFLFVFFSALFVFALTNSALAENKDASQDLSQAEVQAVDDSQDMTDVAVENDIANVPAENETITDNSVSNEPIANYYSDLSELESLPLNYKLSFEFSGGSGIVKKVTESGWEDVDLNEGLIFPNEGSGWEIECATANLFKFTPADLTLNLGENFNGGPIFVVPDFDCKIVSVKLNGQTINKGDKDVFNSDSVISFELAKIDKYTIKGTFNSVDEQQSATPLANYTFGYYASDGTLIGNYITDNNGNFEITVNDSKDACGYIYAKQTQCADIYSSISLSSWNNNALMDALSGNYNPGTIGNVYAELCNYKEADVKLQKTDHIACFNIDTQIDMIFLPALTTEHINDNLETINLDFSAFLISGVLGDSILPTEFLVLDNGALSFSGVHPGIASFKNLITPVIEEGYQFDCWTINGKQYKAGDKFMVKDLDSLNLSAEDTLDSYDKLNGYASVKLPSNNSETEPAQTANVETYSAAQTGDDIPYACMIVVAIISTFVFLKIAKRNSMKD